MLMSLFVSLAIQPARAEDKAEPKPVQYTGEVASKTPYRLKFHPPTAHHFNLEAPPHVDLVSGGQTVAGKIDRTLQLVTVDFPDAKKLAKDCVVKANLTICDDANTFCKPVREEFDCEKLQAKN